MKEKLTKFSRGMFQYERQVLLFSQESIELGIESGKIYEGSLKISTKSHIPIKGILSKTDHFLKLSETSFSGTEVTVPYTYDATELPAGETRTGSILVISNCGEYEIPVVVKVEAPYFLTELGKIRDLFQFANLAKQDWLSAVKIFKSDQFVKKLLCHDSKTEVLYHGLMKSISTSHAMEEFLISIHKKVRINLTLDKTSIEYSNVCESLQDRIVIYKDNWGYTEIRVEADADFIEPEHKIIWSENFIGNSYNLKFLIKKENLKPGLNHGSILLKTPHQNLRVEIVARGEEQLEVKQQNVKDSINHQENLITLSQNYLNFRMNRIAAEDYLLQMRTLLNQMYESGETEYYYLLKAHLAVSIGDMDEISECFRYLDKCRDEWEQDDPEKYAAYQYLIAMKDREQDMIEVASGEIEKLYQKQPDNWKIFWFFMNVKREYMEEPRKRFEALQELLRNGVRSRIIYYEASVLYREHPVFLAEVSEEALPVMTWMVRENCMSEEVKQQYLLMVSKRKHFYPILFHSLEKLYEEQEDAHILQVILSILIRTQKAGRKYFKWYELGIQKQVRILQLYEYYMYSMEEDIHTVLPESVVTYFSVDCTLNEKKRTFLYANIVENWEKYDKVVLEGYEEAIHQFAKKELEKRVINRNLAILYEELCTSEAFDETVKANLPYVMFQQEIRCENPDIIGVAVAHKEVEKEVYTPLEGGVAQVAIYTDTAQIFLVDRKNNRYAATMEYYVSKYLFLNELAKECLSFAEQNGMLLLYLYEQMETYHKYAQTAVTIRKRILMLDELKTAFYWECFGKLVNYYYDTTQVALLDELLQNVDFSYFDPEERARMMELCMVRGVNADLEEQFERYGYDKLSPKRLLSYCCKQLTQNPERQITQLFLDICYYALLHGKNAKQTTSILCEHYVGSLEQLIRIWKACKEYSLDCVELEEQIVSQSLFGETKRKEVVTVFYEYNSREQKDKMVVKAYLSYRAYEYLLRDEEIEAPLVEIMKEFILYNNCNIANLAYLKILSKQERLTEKEQETAEIQVGQFVKQGITLPFFIGFKRHFPLPYEIANKYFVDYRCNANRKVVLHYALNSERFKEEVMKNCYQGIYVKNFVLFHGNTLSYYMTEQGENYEKRTETITINYEDDMSETDSEYSLLNSLLVAKEVQDSKTVLELMKRYMTGKTIVSEQFKMLD